MKDREIQCRYYLNERNCSRGHEGTFRSSCQHCKDYVAKKGAKPKRVDRRRQKIAKMLNDKRNW